MMHCGLIFTMFREACCIHLQGVIVQGEWHCWENNTAVTQGLLVSEDGGSSCFQKTSNLSNWHIVISRKTSVVGNPLWEPKTSRKKTIPASINLYIYVRTHTHTQYIEFIVLWHIAVVVYVTDMVGTQTYHGDVQHDWSICNNCKWMYLTFEVRIMPLLKIQIFWDVALSLGE